MAENASLARPYAQAVFDLATQSQQLSAWHKVLLQLQNVVSDADFVQLIRNPKVTQEQVYSLTNEVISEPVDGTENFVKLLIKNQRLELVSDIVDQFDILVAKSEATIEAEIITAIALTETQKTVLTSALEQRLKLKVTVKETVDTTLIGGAIIKAGDLVIDGSAKGRIGQLTDALLR